MYAEWPPASRVEISPRMRRPAYDPVEPIGGINESNLVEVPNHVIAAVHVG